MYTFIHTKNHGTVRLIDNGSKHFGSSTIVEYDETEDGKGVEIHTTTYRGLTKVKAYYI